MTLDIASSPPVSQNTAGDGPSGAGPPTPASGDHAFAAMLAHHKPLPADHSPGTGRKTPNETRDGKTRRDQKDTRGEKDAASDQTLSQSSPVPVQTPAAPAIILPSLMVPPCPPVLIAPAPNASAADFSKTSEAMDTSLAGATALSGGNAPISGGELLPQTLQTLASADGQAAAPPVLPDALAPPAPAPTTGVSMSASATTAGISMSASTAAASAALLGTPGPEALPGTGIPAPSKAQGQASPAALQGSPAVLLAPSSGTAASAAAAAVGTQQPSPSPGTQIALQGYAQFGQTDLQNTGQPANNTGKSGNALAFQAARALGKSASLASSLQQASLPAALTDLGQRAVEEWTQAGQTGADDAKDKSSTAGKGASDTFVMPTAAQAGEAKAAPVSMPPLAPADRAALMQQASESMQSLHAQVLGQGHGQMTLQLHPQDWGKLQVSVTMTPDGKGTGGTLVTAYIVADSASVKQALETGGADLRRTLREAGLHLETMTVTVRPPTASTEAQTMGGGQDGSPRQSASQDAQWGTGAGSRGESAPGGMAGNGQPTFGGGNTNSGTQNRDYRQTSQTLPSMTDDYQDQAPQAIAASHTAGRLDTRA